MPPLISGWWLSFSPLQLYHGFDTPWLGIDSSGSIDSSSWRFTRHARKTIHHDLLCRSLRRNWAERYPSKVYFSHYCVHVCCFCSCSTLDFFLNVPTGAISYSVCFSLVDLKVTFTSSLLAFMMNTNHDFKFWRVCSVLLALPLLCFFSNQEIKNDNVSSFFR